MLPGPPHPSVQRDRERWRWGGRGRDWILSLLIYLGDCLHSWVGDLTARARLDSNAQSHGPCQYTLPSSDLGFEKNLAFVWPSPYPPLNPSPTPSPSRKKVPPLRPHLQAQRSPNPIPASQSRSPAPGSQSLAALEWLEESWGCLREVCL